jgi:carboxylesterase
VTGPILAGAEPFRFDGGRDGILMIHGFSGSPASMRPMGAWFAEQGLSVLGVRLPGHGTSVEDFGRHPWPEWVAETERGLKEMRSRCDRVVVVALSFGCALAVHLAAERPEEVEGLALASPHLFDARVALAPVLRPFLRGAKGVGDDIRKEGQTEIAYDRIPVEALVSLAAFLRIARRDLPRVRAPALVFRPGEDHTIPARGAERVLAGLGSTRKELVECPGSYHVITLDNDAPAMQERVLRFVHEL